MKFTTKWFNATENWIKTIFTFGAEIMNEVGKLNIHSTAISARKLFNLKIPGNSGEVLLHVSGKSRYNAKHNVLKKKENQQISSLQVVSVNTKGIRIMEMWKKSGKCYEEIQTCKSKLRKFRCAKNSVSNWSSPDICTFACEKLVYSHLDTTHQLLCFPDFMQLLRMFVFHITRTNQFRHESLISFSSS